MRRLGIWTKIVSILCVMAQAALAQAADTGASEPDYLRDVQPILAQRCAGCHGVKKQEGGLRLDGPAGVLAGGDSGPAIVAGKSAESRLIQAVTGADDVTKMPPEGTPLTDAQIALLKRWIDSGAKAPQGELAKRENSDHWAFQPCRRPALPKVKNTRWPQNGIDYFVLARLEALDIAPSPPASRETLIRRLSFDLRGLPPTPREIEDFLADSRPGAYERLVDRMFASPAYGERWGRHWLDLARYADSNGYTRDFGRVIWKYRDWVINAINADMPFDTFTIEQFAGDLLPDATLDQKIATGFHRNTLINEEGGTDQEQFRVEAVADRVETTGSVYLGLTVGCARCHQHKYDPISQRDFYQLFAFLDNCDEPTIDAPSPEQIARGELKARKQIRKKIAGLSAELDRIGAAFDAKQVEWEKSITPQQRVKLPGPLQAALMIPLAKRNDEEKQRVRDFYKTTDQAKAAFPQVAEIARLRASEPAIPTTMVLRRRAEPRETHIHKRGNFLDPGARVFANVPAVLNPLPKTELPDRLMLAKWLIDPANPLTSRVTVNRFWQRFFGRGIVETENDFGTQGTPPTHPLLLDWLATEFVRGGWSMKAIQRQIVTSAAYRQSSRTRPELAEVDPRNLLLARQSRLRLDAEIIRDVALSASGLLHRRIGGPSVFPPQPAGVFAFTQDPKPWNTPDGPNRYRRGMYTHFWRSSPYPALMVFDFPNSNVTCTRRVRSNTPIQALTLANDEVFLECAQALAQRVILQGGEKTSERIQFLMRISLSRRASDAEAQRLTELYEDQYAAFRSDPKAAESLVAAARGRTDGNISTGELAAWISVCRVVLNLDEFITRE